MLVTYKWLSEFVEINLEIDELCERITLLGLEEVGKTKVGIHPENEKNILLGKVSDCQKHPKADKLHVCKISVKGGHHQIITNSPNIEKGDYVVYCKPGTVLPGGMEVGKRTLKGMESEGMLLAKESLGLEPKSDDIWILGKDEKAAKEEFEVYSEADYVIELDLTANRSDCLSIIGVAREVSAMLGKELKFTKPVIEADLDEEPSITISERGLCPRYSSRLIRGIVVGKSPHFITRRLELCGIRSINNIVDATNYVQLEYGHPTHAFDLNRLEGEKIIVRRAKAGEKFTTLDSEEHELSEQMLVIADEKKAVALAGVMGGENSEIIDATRNLLLESAYFDAVSIRKTSKALGMHTESSHRFERTADWGITPVALDRIAQLILMSSPGHVSKANDAYVNMIKDKIIAVNAKFVSGKLGAKFTLAEIEDILVRLGFAIMVKRDDSIEVKVPSFRSDIERPIDIVEEIARVYGYNNIPTPLFKPPVDLAGLVEKPAVKPKIREILTGDGFTEIYNLSFTNSDEMKAFGLWSESVIELGNPLTNDSTHLRNAIFPGMLKSIAYNNKSAYRFDLRFFEIGQKFSLQEGEMIEEGLLGIAVSGPERNYYDLLSGVELLLNRLGLSTFDIKAVEKSFLHPKNGAEILIGKESIGFLGEVHPDIVENAEIRYPVFIAELKLQKLQTIFNSELKISAVSKFPPSRRDLSVLVARDVNARDMMNTIEKMNDWIDSVSFTDIFEDAKLGENKKSVTLSISFTHPERTLKDDEVTKIIDHIIDSLKQKFGAELR